MSVVCDSCKQIVEQATEINMWNQYLECDLCNAIKTLRETGYPSEIIEHVKQWQRDHPIAGLARVDSVKGEEHEFTII